MNTTADRAPDDGPGGAQVDPGDVYESNIALYEDPALVEGVDYARPFRRDELFSDGDPRTGVVDRTAVIAPHGGGIEFGTSELCVAIAGRHPATLQVIPGIGTTYGYWMFEGLRTADNAVLHVTATHCNDAAALSVCGSVLNALAVHGCTTQRAKLPDDAEAVLVGGRNATFKQRLLDAFADAEIDALDAAGNLALRGEESDNIVNRTLLGMGAQLEITAPLRARMFEDNTRPRRRDTTTATFWTVVTACRIAIARLESEQPIL